jgi:hypothetical protein
MTRGESIQARSTFRFDRMLLVPRRLSDREEATDPWG